MSTVPSGDLRSSETRDSLPPPWLGPSYKAHCSFQPSCFTLNPRVTALWSGSNKPFFSTHGTVFIQQYLTLTTLSIISTPPQQFYLSFLLCLFVFQLGIFIRFATLWNSFFFFFLQYWGFWTQGLMLARKVLYNSSYSTSPTSWNFYDKCEWSNQNKTPLRSKIILHLAAWT
jgi:hypothetical protein